MNNAMKLFFVFVLIVFVLGITICLNPLVSKENMENMLDESEENTLEQIPTNNCPDLLIRSGEKLYLHNRNLPESDTNPLIFNNLDEYLEYLQDQRKKDIRCPILFLQEEENTQGKTVYRMRPSPTSMEAGAPIQPVEIADGSRDRPPFNENLFAGFDPHGYNIGQYSELDAIHDSTANAKVSDNPMDSNWGGIYFSQAAVDSGKYANREVGKQTMTPKVLEIYK